MLLKAAKKREQHSHRDYTAILIAYRHGLRASELCNLTWDNVDLDHQTIFIKRCKGSLSGTHPLLGDEIRALRHLRREYPNGKYVFQSQKNDKLSPRRFAEIVKQAGIDAGLEIDCHPHMLRHSTGYKLIQKHDLRTVQQYLGHKSIASTIIYTALSPNAFNNLWSN